MKPPLLTGAGAPPSPPVRIAHRWAWLLLSVLILAGVTAASIAVGSVSLPLSTVWDALTAPDGSMDHLTVRTLRVPRTILGLLVGAALGAAGALIQGLTRNPLADPGILGVNGGAGFAIVLGVAAFGVTEIEQYLWFGFAGAVLATALVYVIASRAPGGADPLRLTLVGVALGAVLTGATKTLALLDPETFDRMRFWDAGTIADRPAGTVQIIWPFIVAGLVTALVCARSLNALALGEDLAAAVGVRLPVVRTAAVVAVTLLCGAATAAAGPLVFVGLMVPHAVRRITGPDQRWIMPFTLVLAPVLVLLADIAGRLIIRPAELQVGVVIAYLGAPVLIALIRRRRAEAS
ncbi:iron chelate uptake ABC transporter family permease subunit [Nocardia sp. NPDC003345]